MKKEHEDKPSTYTYFLKWGSRAYLPKNLFTWFPQEFFLEEHPLHIDTWMFMRWYFLSFFPSVIKSSSLIMWRNKWCCLCRWLSRSSVPRKPFLWDSPVSYSRCLTPWVWIYFWEMWSVTGEERTPGMGRPGKRLQRRNIISMPRRHNEVWLGS